MSDLQVLCLATARGGVIQTRCSSPDRLPSLPEGGNVVSCSTPSDGRGSRRPVPVKALVVVGDCRVRARQRRGSTIRRATAAGGQLLSKSERCRSSSLRSYAGGSKTGGRTGRLRFYRREPEGALQKFPARGHRGQLSARSPRRRRAGIGVCAGLGHRPAPALRRRAIRPGRRSTGVHARAANRRRSTGRRSGDARRRSGRWSLSPAYSCRRRDDTPTTAAIGPACSGRLCGPARSPSRSRRTASS